MRIKGINRFNMNLTRVLAETKPRLFQTSFGVNCTRNNSVSSIGAWFTPGTGILAPEPGARLQTTRTLAGYHGFRNPGARLAESSVFLQTGNKISELPLVVRKVNDIFELYKRLGQAEGLNVLVSFSTVGFY